MSEETPSSKQKLIDLLADRARKHDALRLAETAFHEGRAEGYQAEVSAFDIAHGEALDWLADNLDELLAALRADETTAEQPSLPDISGQSPAAFLTSQGQFEEVDEDDGGYPPQVEMWYREELANTPDDSDLVRRWFLHQKVDKRGRLLVVVVTEVFGVGSVAAFEICRSHGYYRDATRVLVKIGRAS